MRRLAIMCVTALAVAACGGAQSDEADASGAAPAAQAPPAGITVVAHPRLEALLPTLAGWTMGKPTGETDTTESVSRVTVDYESNSQPATISVELMDSCMNPYMLGQIKEWLNSTPAALLAQGYTAATVRGFPAIHEWTAESRHGEVHVLVGDRFMVKVTGDYVTGLDVVVAATEAIDLPKLAGLR